MMRKKRKIALVIDNCLAHNKPPKMANVEVLFFPPNCTSVLQPLDQGIIRSAKSHYRTRMLQRILLNIHLKRDNSTAINILQAIEMATGGWWSVTETVIKNCWKKAGFVRREEDEAEASENSSGDDCDDEAELAVMQNLEELNDAWNEYSAIEELSGISVEDYLNADSDALVASEMTEEDIVRQIRESELGEAHATDSEEDEEEIVTRKLSTGEAVQRAEDLQMFLMSIPDVPDDMLINLDKIRSFCVSKSTKHTTLQTKIDDYIHVHV